MMRYCISLAIILTLFDAISAAPTPCNKLQKVNVNIKDLLANQPYTCYWSSWPIFKCTDAAYVPPQTGQTGYNLTAIVTAGKAAVYFHLILGDESIWDATLCSEGNKFTRLKVSISNILNVGYNNKYPTIYLNPTSMAMCVASCAPDKVGYKHVMCWGKTPADKADMKQFLDKHEIPFIFDTQNDCAIKNKVCSVVDQGKTFVENVITPKIF